MTDEPLHPLSPFPWRPSMPALERLFLLGILGALALYKVRFNLATQSLGTDGGLYFDVAMNVRDGLGLTTDIALFNSSFPYFPHPTVLYPLWPLLLGWVGRWVPLWEASIWLPTLLYFACLLLLYRLMQKVLPGPLFPETWPVLNAGHAAVLLLGINEAFFIHTSKPFTEGLAFLILFLALFRIKALCERLSLLLGLEVGLWLGLLVLTRSQLILAPMALVGALVWMGGAALLSRSSPGYSQRIFWSLLGVMAGFGVIMGEQLLFFATFMDHPSFTYIMRFDLHKEPSPLSQIQVMVKTHGLWDYVQDRASGILVAFGASKHSYLKGLGPIFMALPIALPFLMLDAGRVITQRRGRQVWAWLIDPRHLFTLFGGLFALGGFLSLHTIHKANFSEWNFGTRHALTAFFLFFGALIYLSKRPQLGRAVALMLLIGATYVTFDKTEQRLKHLDELEAGWTRIDNQPLLTFLEAENAKKPGLRVVAPDIRIQRLGAYTSGIGYYWYYRRTTFQDLEHLFTERGADYLLVPGSSYLNQAFQVPRPRFDATYALIQRDVSGVDVYVRREKLEERQALTPQIPRGESEGRVSKPEEREDSF